MSSTFLDNLSLIYTLRRPDHKQLEQFVLDVGHLANFFETSKRPDLFFNHIEIGVFS